MHPVPEDFKFIGIELKEEEICSLPKSDYKEKIKTFWDDVLKYREIGFESLITKKKIDKENKSKFVKQQPELTFLPDSS